ncbi:MAG: sensor histidine kinase KdpD [Bdellovibrionales bacterium]|nr:sensor histidine kinase KdpD [Bdellovibrionales bacterium]
MPDSQRPNPDELLDIVKSENVKATAQLRIFFGMSAGVGKTYAMLEAAHEAKEDGVDVVIGVVETHGRRETAELLEGLELIPRKKINYRGTELQEMDLDAILKRRPKLVIVDELAHTNAPGTLHPKRYQDVLQLLEEGIDVYTAVNVQHIESRKDSVEKITGISIRETVPDSIIERANHIELIDITPAGLLKRLREGKVYLEERAERAAQNFFKEAPLSALREIALRLTAEKVDYDLQDYSKLHGSEGPWNTNERLMVAVSHSPYSERLIRATRRYAFNLEAPWMAIHVDTGEALNNADQAQLSKNLSLARELGAEVVTVPDIDVTEALQRVAKQRNVTQLIIGRPTQRFLRDHFEGGTVLDRLVRQTGEFDVHVIRQETPPETERRWMPEFSNLSAWIQYWYVFWMMVGVTIFANFTSGFLGFRSIGFIYLLAILGLSLIFSLGPVLFAAALSSLLWNFFFIPPKYTFAISSVEDILLCVSYFFVAVTTGYLTYRIRKHERIFQEREERTQFLYQITKDIAAGGGKEVYLSKVAEQLSGILKGNCGFILKGTTEKLDFNVISSEYMQLSEKEQAVALWAFENEKAAGWSTDNLPSSRNFYLPMKTFEGSVGLIVFKPKRIKRLGIDHENLLFTVGNQVAIALEREALEEKSKTNDRLRESEKLHQALMNSVSHELRTPLTTIIGSASTLSDAKVQENPEMRKELSEELVRASHRLNRVIENLLDMTRLNSGMLSLKKDWYDVRELLKLTVKRLNGDLGDHHIDYNFGDVPLIKIDYRLLEQVFANLILNAVAYTPERSPIHLTVYRDMDLVVIRVRDEGPGLPLDALQKVFEKFYRVPGTKAGGTGLGLFIAKSLVEAHGGTIEAQNSSAGGAEFVICLPIEPMPQVLGENS